MTNRLEQAASFIGAARSAQEQRRKGRVLMALGMRIRFGCHECVNAQLDAGEDPRENFWQAEVEFNDTNAYEARCPNGHLARAVLQNPRHEVLFDAATLALLDGYYREAIATYGGALERFFEFFARVVFFHFRGANDSEADQAKIWQGQLEAVRTTSEKWAALSERQFGMFLFAHLLLAGAPPSLNKRQHEEHTALRNRVIHAGKIVTKCEAFAFGDYVYETVHSLSKILRQQCPEAITRETLRSLVESGKHLSPPESDYSAGSMTTVALLSNAGTDPHKSFSETIEDFERSSYWVAFAERYTLQRMADALGLSVDALGEKLRAFFSTQPAAVPDHNGGDDAP